MIEQDMADDECCTVTCDDTSPIEYPSDRLAASNDVIIGNAESSEIGGSVVDALQFGFFPPNSIDNGGLPDFAALDTETQERLQSLLQAAGIAKSAGCDGQTLFADPEVLRRLSSSVSCALDEAADALTRMKSGNGGQSSCAIVDDIDRLSTPTIVGDNCFDSSGAPVSVEDGESLLSLACSAGYYELAQVLLAMRTNIEDRGSKGDCTPLMEAASAGHIDIVKLLLAHGADPNAQSSTGNTALMYACAGGHESVVNTLLDADADVELRNENGHCPLMEAASAGHVNIARALVTSGASVQSVGQAEFKVGLESPLTLASYKGHIEMVKYLLKAGPKVNVRLEELHTALMEASMDGHMEVAKVLLDFGAPVNLASDSFESPLTLAACGGHVDLVRLLLDRGAQIEEPNDEGYTPLMEASREGHEDVVELLLDRGANVNAQTEETGETALTLAACGGFRDVVELLVRRGGDLDMGANTPLMEAAQEGHLDTVKFLIQETLGQDDLSIDATTATNDTALTYAAENGHIEVCAALLDAGADIDHEADGGRTSLMKASKAGHFNVVQFVLQRGAQLNKISAANDATALSLACTHGNLDIVQMLLNNGANPNHKLKDSSTCIIEAAKGGHTCVVQLLLDWPGIQLPKFTGVPPPLKHLAANQQQRSSTIPIAPAPLKPSSCKETTNVTLIPPMLPPSSIGVDNDESNAALPSAFNLTLDPQFLASVQKHQQLQQKTVIEQHPSVESASGRSISASTSVKLSNNSSATSGYPTDSAAINSDWLLLQAQKALIKQAGEKLSEAEIQQLSELLKTQFRNVFPNPPLANDLLSSVATASLVDSIATTTTGAKRKASTGSSQPLPDTATRRDMQQKAVNASLKTKSTVAQSTLSPTVINPTQRSVSTKSTAVSSDVCDDPAISNKSNAYGFKFPVPPPPPVVGKKDHNQMTADTPPTAIIPSIQPTAAVIASTPQKVHAATQAGGTGKSSSTTDNNVITSDGIDLDTQTESNHDTALTLACSGGHDELVALLLQRGADIEHRDKKGFTPLILAATAGHVRVVDALLNHGANIEAQSERTKDTALSLACSGGRKEVVDLLLKKNANKEHRNVSDYTPLSLAASGGYVEICQALLNTGAEINSRTGSKLGISPLMLSAMNGHTNTTKLLLERGSDINAQIETNRNTALTLACFQGRHEVVKLLLEYHANVEHRAKTGLTPLMEAANGGYVDVGRLLLHHDADPNTAPVPTSRDTALTIAADKGHHKFVELLIHHGAQIDSRNKKGCTPLWLACHGGHLDAVQTLVKHCSDVDAQDNRRVSPLMIAFRKGHLKIVKYMVRHVQQFPSDQECYRYIATVTDKDLLVKCRQCMEVIVAAKDRQAAEANKAAETLLELLAKEEEQAMIKKLAKQRQNEKKKAKRQAKKAQTTQNVEEDEEMEESNAMKTENNNQCRFDDDNDDRINVKNAKSSQPSSCSPSPPPPPPAPQSTMQLSDDDECAQSIDRKSATLIVTDKSDKLTHMRQQVSSRVPTITPPDEPAPHQPSQSICIESAVSSVAPNTQTPIHSYRQRQQQSNDDDSSTASLLVLPTTKSRRGNTRRNTRNNDTTESPSSNHRQLSTGNTSKQQKDRIVSSVSSTTVSTVRDTEWSRAGGLTKRRGANRKDASQKLTETNTKTIIANSKDHPDDPYTTGWREVDNSTRRRSNKLNVSSSAIARVIGRGGQNINAIREATGAHIEVEKQQLKKEQQDRLITIRGSTDAARQAVDMINGLINDNEAPVQDIIKRIRDRETAQQLQQQQIQSTTVTTASTVANMSTASRIAVTSRPASSTTPTIVTSTADNNKRTFDVSVWSSSTDTTQSTTTTSSTTADYSPFATPNVWQQRAAMRQLQQGLQQKRVDFASITASRSTGGSSSPIAPSTPFTTISSSIVSTSLSSSCTPTIPICSTSTSEAIVHDDQRKAPGYARPASATQQHSSPTNNNLRNLCGLNSIAIQPLSATRLTSANRQSIFESPVDKSASSSLSHESTILDGTFTSTNLNQSTTNRPASAIPAFGLTSDSFSSTISYSAAPGGPSSHSPTKKSNASPTPSQQHESWMNHEQSNVIVDMTALVDWRSQPHDGDNSSSATSDQLGLLQNLAQLRVQAHAPLATSDWDQPTQPQSRFNTATKTPSYGTVGVHPSAATLVSTWQSPSSNRPTPSIIDSNNSNSWINQIAAQLAGQQGSFTPGSHHHHQPSMIQQQQQSQPLYASMVDMFSSQAGANSMQQQQHSSGILANDAELSNYFGNVQQQSSIIDQSMRMPPLMHPHHLDQPRMPPSTNYHLQSMNRYGQLFSQPPPPSSQQQPLSATIYPSSSSRNDTSTTTNTTIPPPTLAAPPPPFFNAQLPPPLSSSVFGTANSNNNSTGSYWSQPPPNTNKPPSSQQQWSASWM